jgi:hypothetical protein
VSSEAAIVVAIFIITTSLVLLMSRVARGRLQAKEDELKKAAALRGWTFGKKTERGYRIYTFSGTTEGIPWEAESAVLVAGSNRRQRRRHVARWHGKWSPGVAAPIAAMGVPKGKEVMTHKIAQSDGFLAQMAQKAAGYAFDMALDVYFGKEIGGQIDATTFKHIDQPAVPGYIFMAADPDEAKRVLSEGLQRAPRCDQRQGQRAVRRRPSVPAAASAKPFARPHGADSQDRRARAIRQGRRRPDARVQVRPTYFLTSVTFRSSTRCAGSSPLTATASIFSTTSRPLSTLPNTVY